MMSWFTKEGDARPSQSDAAAAAAPRPTRRWLAAGVIAASCALSGCGSLGQALTGAPDTEALQHLPVVDYGKAPPAGPYVLRFKAGQPIASLVRIEGTALAADEQTTLSPVLKRDLYVHKRWVSFDGKTWLRQQDALAFHLQLHLPSDQDPKAPQMVLKIQQRQG